MTRIAKYFHKYLFNDLNNQMVCPEANYRPENSKNNNRNSLTLPHPSFPFKKTVIKGKCFPTVSFISSLEKKSRNAGRAGTNSGKEMYTANKFRSARPTLSLERKKQLLLRKERKKLSSPVIEGEANPSSFPFHIPDQRWQRYFEPRKMLQSKNLTPYAHFRTFL